MPALLAAGCSDVDSDPAATGSVPETSIPGDAVQHLQPEPPYEQAPIPEGFVSSGIAPAIWYLAPVSDDGQTIEAVLPGGCGSRFAEFTVESTADAVTVLAWQETLTTEIYDCPLELNFLDVTLRLPEPLAGRELFGACTPGDATVEERLCQASSEHARLRHG